MAIAPMDGSSTSRKASMAGSTKPRVNPRTLPTMMQLITRMPISRPIVAGHLYLAMSMASTAGTFVTPLNSEKEYNDGTHLFYDSLCCRHNAC